MLAWIALAWGLTPEEADDRIRSMDDLEAVTALARPVDRPIRLRQGVMDVTLTSGAMVPVFSGHFAGAWENEAGKFLRKLRDRDPEATLPSAEQRGDRELVGFVWVDGEGSVGVDLPYEADALELGNRQVMYLGAEREAMEPVALGLEPFRTQATEGLFLTTSPELDALFLGPEATDPYEIVVWAGSSKLRRAVELLERRLELWDAVGLDLGGQVAAERTVTQLGGEIEHTWVVDLHTEARYGRVSNVPTPDDRWLAWVDGHRLSQSWDGEVVTAGFSPQGGARWSHISGLPADTVDPDDQLSAPRSSHQQRIEHVQARVLVQHQRNALTLPVEITNRVTLRAEADMLFVELIVPRVEAVADTFEWVSAALPDGTPLARPEQVERRASEVVTREKPKPKPKPGPWEPDDDDEDEERVTAHRVRLVFPELVRAGDEVVVDLQWKDSWPLAHLSEVDAVGTVSHGKSSGLQRFLASLEGDEGQGYAFDARVGLPADSKLVAVVSGPDEQEVSGGWRWTVVEGVDRARFPNVVVGDYRTRYDKAAKGMPAVRVSLLQGDDKRLKTLGAQARGIMAYYETFLPSYGLPEYDIVEGPAAIDHYTWVAPHGMQVMQRTLQTRGLADLARMKTTDDGGWGVFAHEVAHQWWGQQAQPGGLDDRWMVESFAEVFSCMFVAKVHENVKKCLDQRQETRRALEGNLSTLADHRVSVSLAEAYHEGPQGFVVYQYGPYVLQQMLRPRVGTDAFFLGVHQMLKDHPREGITNERLQHYLERASGQKLGDFFDFWVRQGIVPGVDITATIHRGTLELTGTTDVPFGVFEVPVVLTDKLTKRQILHRLQFRDGEAYGEVVGDFRRGVSVDIDPGNRTPLKRASLKQVQPEE